MPSRLAAFSRLPPTSASVLSIRRRSTSAIVSPERPPSPAPRSAPPPARIGAGTSSIEISSPRLTITMLSTAFFSSRTFPFHSAVTRASRASGRIPVIDFPYSASTINGSIR